MVYNPFLKPIQYTLEICIYYLTMFAMQFQIFWGVPGALLKDHNVIPTRIEVLTLKNLNV